MPRVTALRLRPRHRRDLTLDFERDYPVLRAVQVRARNVFPGAVVDVDTGDIRRRLPGERCCVLFCYRGGEVVEEGLDRVAAVHLLARRLEEWDGRVVGIFGEERAGEVDEFPYPAREAVRGSEGKSEVFDGVGTGEGAGGVHY